MLIAIPAMAAAQKIDSKQVQAQLKKAQAAMDSVKKSHPEIQQAINDYNEQKSDIQKQINKAKAEAADKGIKMDIALPDVDKLMHTPDFNKINSTIEQGQKNLAQLKSNISASNKNSLPQKSATPFSTKPVNINDVRKWAVDMLANAKLKSVMLEPVLKTIYNDTSTNAASVGMLLIAARIMPKYAGQYLVCRYILDHPDNAAAINDLGIFMRFEKDYAKAIPLFLYAQQLNDSSLEIKVNLGWAYAYAGDFSKAKNYFNSVLKINPDYATATEGLSLIAYQEGDRQTLWNNLTKQLFSSNKTFGFSGSFPSNGMAGFCGGILNEDALNKMDKANSNSFNKNNSYDNPNPPDRNSLSDEKCVETAPDISYDEYKEDFPSDLDEVKAINCSKAIDKYEKAIQSDIQFVQSLLQTLPKPQQAINSDGEYETVFDYGNDAHYIFFNQMHVEFQKRSTWIYGRSNDKLTSAVQSFAATYNGVFQAFTAALKKCKDEDPDCPKAVECEYFPKLSGTIKSFAMSVGDIVTTGFDEYANEVDWYRNASSPMLQYIAEPNWNKYLNAVREADVRKGKLMLMMAYQNIIKASEIFVSQAKGFAVDGGCYTPIRIAGQNISTPRLRNLKTLAPPCKPSPEDKPIYLGPFFYEDNCSHTRIGVDADIWSKKYEHQIKTESGKAGIKGETSIGATAYFEKVKSKYVEDDYYRGGIALHAKAEIGIDVKEEGNFGFTKIKTYGSAQAKIDATLDISRSWDANGNPTQQSIAWDATASVSGKAGINAALSDYTKANKDFFNASFEKGLHSDGEFVAVFGANGQLGNYNLRSINMNTIGK